MFVNLPAHDAPEIPYIRIDHFDTWSMDRHLARIVSPMLKQLLENKHGCPFEFVPPDPNSSDQLEFGFMDDDRDAAFERGTERWTECMRGMAWSFEEIASGRYHDHWPTGPYAVDPYYQRVQRGLNDFATHYGSLWD